MKQIVVVGSVNLDMVCSVERIPVPGETLSGTTFQTFNGGKGANQAVAIAKLGYPVSMVANVGEDQFGPGLRKGLSGAGVNVERVSVARNTSSGVALISIDRTGQNSIVVVSGANGVLSPQQITQALPLLHSAGMILTQLEVPLETVAYLVEVAHEMGVPVMLDPAPARELPQELLRKVTYFTPNESEAGAFTGRSTEQLSRTTVHDYASDLLGLGPETVVLKMGQYGAYIVTRGGEAFYQPAFHVNAVDSTAAGDAFNGGLAVALMQGDGLKAAARYAAAVAAISVSRAGAQPSMPTADEVAEFLKSAQCAGGNFPDKQIGVAGTE